MDLLVNALFMIGFIGSPFYLLYLWQNHAPANPHHASPGGRIWVPRMKVTSKRRWFAFLFGICSGLSGLLILPSFFAIFGLALFVPLFGYAIGGEKVLKLIPDWSEFYDGSKNTDLSNYEDLEGHHNK